MNSNNVPNTPAIGGAYIPYFYQAGLYHRYSVPPSAGRKPAAEDAVSGYDLASTLSSSRPLSEPQTVEQIIARGYLAVPRTDPTTGLLTDKRATSWLGLDDIVQQVRTRYELFQRTLYDLELAKCAASNSLFEMIGSRGSGPATPRELYSLHKRMQDLYAEEREERVNLWQDVSRLKLALPEVAQQYLAAYRKIQILESEPGDEP